MLEIYYSKDGQKEEKITFDDTEAFLAAEYLEVPPFQDYYKVSKVLVDGEELVLTDKTIGGLFNALNK